MPDTVFPNLLNTVFIILDVPLIFTLLIVFHEMGDFSRRAGAGLCWVNFALGLEN
jgi:hypothetical protein